MPTTQYIRYPSTGGGGGSGNIADINGQVGPSIAIVAGTGINIVSALNQLTISATGGGGTVTSVTASSPLFSSGGVNPNLTIQVANASQNGYLSSADWTTFNSKQSALTFGDLTDVGTDGIVITGGTGAIIGSGTSIAQQVANTTDNGYLSSTDWNTFNNKLDPASIVKNPNTFAGFDNAGDLESVPGYAFDPTNFNGIVWNQSVDPGINTDYKILHNIYSTYNPTADSKQSWQNFWVQSDIGTDNSGFSFGDYVDIKSTLTEQDVTFTSNRYGVDGDVITMQYTAGGTAGSEVLTNPSAFDYILQIENGVSTATQIVSAINSQIGSFGNSLVSAVSGTGSNPQTIFGPTNLAGGENANGGLDIMHVNANNTNMSNVGYLNGQNISIVQGNGTDIVHGNQWHVINGNLAIRNNSDLQYASAIEIGFDFQGSGLQLINDFRGINLYGNLGNVGHGILPYQAGLNLSSAQYINVYQSSINASGNITNSVNTFSDFSNYQGDIGDNYYGVAIQPNINSTDGFFGVNISPNVTLARGFSAGINIDMQNVTLAAGTFASVVFQDITYTANNAGTGLNGVQVEYIGDVLAGNEVANLVGNTIQVHIESGVSTATQVQTAVLANITIISNLTPTITGTASNPQVAGGPVTISGGTNGGSKDAININNGDINGNNTRLNVNYELDTANGPLDFVFGIHRLGGSFKVSPGFPISGGQFGFLDNLGINLDIQDDIGPDGTGADIGTTNLASIGQISVAAGKTVQTLNLVTAGGAINGGSGNVTNLSMFRALGFLPQAGSLNVTNFYGFKADPVMAATGATNLWSFYDGCSGNNYFSKIAVDTSTQKVSNSSIGIEIGGSTKALRLSNLTTTERNALTALAGMEIYNTTTSQVEFYNGSVWTAGSGSSITPVTEYHTVTAPEEAAKQFTLSSTPLVAVDTLVDVITGGPQQFSLDFTITGNIFDWSGLGLDGLLTTGDVVRCHYFT